MLNYHRLRFFLLLVGQFLFIGIAALANEYKISILVESQVFTGKTLFVDVSKKMKQTIVEVDTHGKILWQHTPAIPNRALLLDVSYLNNDHILYTAKGYGVIEIDRSGKIIWKHLDTEASHDADRLPNGNTIYNRGWVSKGEDVVREITPNGDIVWSWNGLKDFDKPPFNLVDDEGWMHVNAVSRLTNGYTVISIRNFNTIVEVNQIGKVIRQWTFRSEKNKTIETKGRIAGERNHEPEMLPSGNILVALRKPLRYVEFNPETEDIVWQWRPSHGVNKAFNRDANRLPNGNTLVTTANQIIEVNSSGVIVWQLDGPVKTDDGDLRVFHKAVRRSLEGQSFGE
jgi:hypothetical protein